MKKILISGANSLVGQNVDKHINLLLAFQDKQVMIRQFLTPNVSEIY